MSPRVLASAVEIDQTLSTWPQVSGEVVLGATAIAEAVRRIGLGEDLRSGRIRIDVGSALDRLDEPQGAPIAPRRRPRIQILCYRACRASSPQRLFVRRLPETRSPGMSRPA